MIPRLKTAYVTKLMSKLNFKNKHEVPKIDKIILNMGLGEDASDGKKIKSCLEDMSLIAGQKPIVTKFKKSISNFKTRKGANAGVKVTLRTNKMYEFIDRLVNIALPRIKDFRGLSIKGIDKSNNYSFRRCWYTRPRSMGCLLYKYPKVEAPWYFDWFTIV